jgi:hypothetical protein
VLVSGAFGMVAIEFDNDLNPIAPVDVISNTVPGKDAERLLGKVKHGDVFASDGEKAAPVSASA